MCHSSRNISFCYCEDTKKILNAIFVKPKGLFRIYKRNRSKFGIVNAKVAKLKFKCLEQCPRVQQLNKLEG